MIKKFILWILVGIWMITIFYFSSQNGKSSESQSEGIITDFLQDGAKVAQKVGIVDHSPSAKKVSKITKNWNAPVRKIAHATVYFVLAFLMLIAIRLTNNNMDTIYWRCVLLVLFLCILYSITDEYHQTFVDGRSGLITDCIVDSFGALLGCVFYTIIKKIKNNINIKK